MTGVAQKKPSLPRHGELLQVLSFLGAYLPLLVSALLLSAGLLLWARRLSGAFEHSLPAAVLCLAGVALAGGSEFLRRCLTSGNGMFWYSRETRLHVPCYLLGWLPVLSAWLMAAAISLPGSSPLGLAGLWICLLLAGVWAGRRQWLLLAKHNFFLVDSMTVDSPAGKKHFFRESDAASPVAEPSISGEAALDERPEPASGDEASADDELWQDQDIVQQFIRRREPDGGEWVTGAVRVAFETGQKTAHAHVAFCPPFLTTPSCDAEPVSGPDAELKVAQVLPQGARFDARLDEVPHEPVYLLVEFAAHWQPAGNQGR
jgi:hypothetical protein